MTLEADVAALTTATTNLLAAVNVSKTTLDQKVSAAATQADLATTNGAEQVALATIQARNAMTQAGIATVKAGEASANAASTLAIYGNTAAMQTAVAQAAAQASLAAGHAASAASVVQQDLSGVTAAALHRSPNAVTAMFVYDTSKDSDGGAWTEKCQHTSWYNEPLSGKWLGAQVSEAAARAVSGATTGDYFQLTTEGKFYRLWKNLLQRTAEFTNSYWSKNPSITVADNVGYSTVTVPNTVAASTNIVYKQAITTIPVVSYSLNVRGPAGTSIRLQGDYGGTTLAFNGDWQTITFSTNGSGGFHQFYIQTVANLQSYSFDIRYPQLEPGSVSTAYEAKGAEGSISEVFRGNKREFPKLSAIVAESSNVTIYDLTEPGRPMWMRFAAPSSTTGVLHWANVANPTVASVSALGGNVVIAGGNETRLIVVNYAKDDIRLGSNGFGFALSNASRQIAGRNGATSYINYGDGFILGASPYNAVAMTVLPDAPVDPVTGLQVPTIAVGTGNGVSIISDVGTVYSVSTNSQLDLSFIKNRLYIDGVTTNSYAGSWAFDVNRTAAAAIASFNGNNVSAFNLQGNSGWGRGVSASSSKLTATSYNSGAGILFLAENKANPLKSSFAAIRDKYNAGYMTGEILRAYLADVDVGSVSNPSTVADRCYKAASATVNGTLTKSAVASAAQLVAYSGFSAANYLRESSFSADLDFGTGEWTASAWVNVPATLPLASFPQVHMSAGDRFNTSDWTKGTGWSAPSATVLVCDGTQTGQSDCVNTVLPNPATTDYEFRWTVTVSAISGTINVYPNNGYSRAITSPGVYYIDSRLGDLPQQTSIIRALSGTTCTLSISVEKVLPTAIVSRDYSSGAKLVLGATYRGELTATAYDGTTTRTVTTSAAYNTGSWIKARATYTTDGTLALLVNGVEVATTRGTPLLTLNNANAVLTIGNSYALDAPFPGAIALLKLGATVPTAEQSVWMYEQEKQMFRENAQVCLPDSGAIVDLTYDDATDKWIAVSATNESEWSGLVRTSVTAVPAGSYTKAAAASGIQLLARSTTSPGVDITIPSYGLRKELVKRAESAARLARNLVPFDYVGGFTASTTNGSTSITSVAGLSYPTSYIGAQITGAGIPAGTVITAMSGTTVYLSKAATATATAVQISFTDFILPVGYEAKAVMSAGALKQEGATKDYTRLFDGFKETLRFGAAPGYTAWVQVQAVRSAA